MARPIEFNRSQALNKALVLFWRKGYQATTLAELLGVMDIGRSSFYAAFTDKRSLFIECLDRFSARTLEFVQGANGGGPSLDALEEFFQRNFSGQSGTVGTKAVLKHSGCMLVNTVLEMAGVDDELAALASDRLSELQVVFEAALVDAGATPLQARELAAMLMLFNEGIRVSSRRRLSNAEHLGPIATTFRLIRAAIAQPYDRDIKPLRGSA